MDGIIDEVYRKAEGMSEEEFIVAVRGKRVVELRIDDVGFDVVFEDGVVFETYDLCLLYSRIGEICNDCEVEACPPLGREFHEKLLKRFVDRTVVDVEYDTDGCVFVFYLDNGDRVCIPPEYGYVLSEEVSDDGDNV